MINQIRGKLTAIVDYRTLLGKKRVEKLGFFLKISYKLIIMEQSGIHGIFLWFRHLFKIDQYVFALVVGSISFLDIRVQHWLLVLPIKSLSLFCGHWNFFKKVSLLIFDVTLLKSWFFSCITFLTWPSQISLMRKKIVWNLWYSFLENTDHFIYVFTCKTLFPIEATYSFSDMIRVCMLIMPHDSFVGWRVTHLKIEFCMNDLIMTIHM